MAFTWNLGALLASIALLVFSADKFTSLAGKIGARLKIPPFIVGLTVVAVGTSLPELVTGLIAAKGGDGGIVIGNVLGSNVANILLIIGLGGVVANGLTTARNLVSVDLPFLLGSIFLLFFVAFDRTITLPEIFLLILSGIVYYIFVFKLQGPIEFMGQSQQLSQASGAQRVGFGDAVLLLVSGGVVFWSAGWVVKSASFLALEMGISQAVVAATIIAVGTSLPELAVSLQAIRQNQGEIAIGNVVGSNIFNTLAVVGFSGLAGRLFISSRMLSFSLPFAVFTTLIFILLIRDKTISRAEGAIMLGLYIALFVGLYAF